MRYQPLGNSGLMVSAVGLGCNNFGMRVDLETTRAVVDAAIDAGVTLFDTADIYGGKGGSETMLGQLLGSRRDDIILATKFGGDMGGSNGADFGARASRRYIRRAVEASLRRLQTDYIDLYQLHTPDPITPLAETISALTELVVEGKVRYIGHSNFAGWQIASAHYLGDAAGNASFISAQNHYSLLERDAEAEVVPACQAFSVGLLPFFPLANGLLTGKVRREAGAPAGTRLAAQPGYLTEDKFDRVEGLEKWAASNGRTLLEVAIGGLAAQPTVSSVIAGATSAEQVRANVAAGEWEPTAEELAEIDAIVPPKRPAR